MLDVLVIGAGLSGLMAAYTAAQNGRTVKVVTKGLGGALHWSAGTIDLLGYVPGKSEKPVMNPGDGLNNLNSKHPYAHLNFAQLLAAIESFKHLTQEIGLPYAGAAIEGENLLLPSPVGAVRPTYLAPKGSIAGDLRQQAPMVIVGFVGLRDFYPELIAENLTKQGYPARALFLPINVLTDRKDSNTVQLAAGLEDPSQLKKLAAALKPQLKKGERVGLPAILGMEGHTAVFTSLENQLGAPVFEIPTLPPSVPGIRLYTALRRKLLGMGVRIEAGMDVINAHANDDHIEWVESETSARPLKHRARQFVLATGGILGGGFDSNMDGCVWETVFDLPLAIPQKRNEWFHASFLNPAGHPVFHGGVAVNDQFQPIKTDKTPVFDNVWAVGNTLAYCDPIQERSLEGISIVTGMVAGQAITNQK